MQDCDLLQQSVPRAVGNLICLVAGLPGKDVMGMVGKLPRLLWMDDLPRRLAQTVDKLLQLHPSKSVSIVHELCAENPQVGAAGGNSPNPCTAAQCYAC